VLEQNIEQLRRRPLWLNPTTLHRRFLELVEAELAAIAQR
jgi:hypothetical protein